MYTADEQRQLKGLTEAEATLIDVARTLQQTTFLKPQEQRSAVKALILYANLESLSVQCVDWLRRIGNALLVGTNSADSF